MHKKIIIAFLLILLLLETGCGQKSEKNPASSQTVFTIVTSFYPIYLHTINVAHDIPGVKVLNMTPPQTGCLHDYSITARDMKRLEEADVFIINGAGLEGFIGKVAAEMPDLKIINASEGITLIKDDEGNDNPHVWVSISNAIKQTEVIGRKLSEADPAHSKEYEINTGTYVKKLKLLSEKMHGSLDNVKNKDIITFHEAFPYFAQEFNLRIAAVIEREPGTEPSARELSQTIDIIKQKKICALFTEPQYSAKAADIISSETGAVIRILDPVSTGEADGNTDAYLIAMEKNLKVLEEALK